MIPWTCRKYRLGQVLLVELDTAAYGRRPPYILCQKLAAKENRDVAQGPDARHLLRTAPECPTIRAIEVAALRGAPHEGTLDCLTGRGPRAL